MQSVATVLEANNLAKASKGLEIEERILNFAKSVKDGGWGCDDDVDGPRKVDRLSLVLKNLQKHQGMDGALFYLAQKVAAKAQLPPITYGKKQSKQRPSFLKIDGGGPLQELLVLVDLMTSQKT